LRADIPESKLQIPAGCPGAPAQVEEAPSNTSKGLIVGVAIGAAAIGLLIGFIVYTMIQRRKSGTDQYQLHTSLTSSDH
jgi:NhaP-type Na+/H+ or K+/H+ antiporter